VSSLSLEEVTDRLRSAEEDVVAPLATKGKLLLTEEEWVERHKKGSDGPVLDPAVAKVVKVESMVVVEEVVVAAIAVMAAVSQAGAGTTTVAINRAIGSVSAGASLYGPGGRVNTSFH
jgi:hypothetical protein